MVTEDHLPMLEIYLVSTVQEIFSILIALILILIFVHMNIFFKTYQHQVNFQTFSPSF
jgi:hypothetical protein